MTDINLGYWAYGNSTAVVSEFKQKLQALEAADDTVNADTNPDTLNTNKAQRTFKIKDLADFMQAQQKHKTHTASDPNNLPFKYMIRKHLRLGTVPCRQVVMIYVRVRTVL